MSVDARRTRFAGDLEAAADERLQACSRGEWELISARHPEPYCISIYEVENTSAGPILKENLVYTNNKLKILSESDVHFSWRPGEAVDGLLRTG
jgi:hypothetical protein